MEKSIKILEDLSNDCVQEKTRYQFSKMIQESEKYKKGRIDALTWINDIIYYFMQKEKNFLSEFKQHIQDQKDIIARINDGDYKNALYDQLNEIEVRLNDRITRK
ncbi:hypothetical protein ALC152_22200 [Arcobacter sp. 15-2]|uniref:hypothetical protein n=1 Tax=Arcobacter sp. 15-2 TaxID=3374109 RepID=UPI00399CAD8C